jgi:hypothetical protein
MESQPCVQNIDLRVRWKSIALRQLIQSNCSQAIAPEQLFQLADEQEAEPAAQG